MKKIINILSFITLFFLIFGCENKEKSYVENVCANDPDYKRCTNDKDYFVEQRLKNWKPSYLSEQVLLMIEETNKYAGEWIGNTNIKKKIVNIKNVKDLYLSKFPFPFLHDVDLKKAKEIQKHLYSLNASIDFDIEQSSATIYNLNFKNNFNQERINVDRFGLDSKQQDILELCYSWVPDKIISCKGKVLITGEIFEWKPRSFSISELKFNYYLEAFKLEKQDIQKIKDILKTKERNQLIKEFNKFHKEKLLKQ